MLTDVKPGDCVRLTHAPAGSTHGAGDAAIVEELDADSKVMTVLWLHEGKEQRCFVAYTGWEKVDAD